MHPDLVLISTLWQLDHQSDLLRAEHDALANAVRAADAAMKVVEVQLAAISVQRDDTILRTRRNDRELADYLDKRDRTRRMIDTGTAPDYAAAEKQLGQVLEIVDRLETAALELMESIEAADLARAGAQREFEVLKQGLTVARAALGARDAPIRAELTDLLGRRPAAADGVPVDYRSPYAYQRQRKRPALVNTREQMCQTCQTRIPGQRIVETTLARAVHTCPGCAGWLLP
ncbi:MAG: hypothetical protein EXR72_17095 [Myxococcales bacterium]|nr:hypothetical protein [Myxococcales bacterium]